MLGKQLGERGGKKEQYMHYCLFFSSTFTDFQARLTIMADQSNISSAQGLKGSNPGSLSLGLTQWKEGIPALAK